MQGKEALWLAFGLAGRPGPVLVRTDCVRRVPMARAAISPSLADDTCTQSHAAGRTGMSERHL